MAGRRIFLSMQPLNAAAVLTTCAPNSVNGNLLPFPTHLKVKYTCVGGWEQRPVLLWKSQQNPEPLLKLFPSPRGARDGYSQKGSYCFCSCACPDVLLSGAVYILALCVVHCDVTSELSLLMPDKLPVCCRCVTHEQMGNGREQGRLIFPLHLILLTARFTLSLLDLVRCMELYWSWGVASVLAIKKHEKGATEVA